jgi:hypothetical protein
MFVHLRRLGVGLIVVAAGVLATASAASALTHDFVSEDYPYILTGEPIGGTLTEFKFGTSSTMTCSVTMIRGTAEAQSNITVTPEYKNCTLSGVAATVDNPCSYNFLGTTNGTGHAHVQVECAHVMNITVNGCTVEIEGQELTEQGVHFENVKGSSPKDVRIAMTMKNGVYREVGALCSLLVGGTGGDLSVVGNYTFRAYEDNGKVEGNQIGFWTVETI